MTLTACGVHQQPVNADLTFRALPPAPSYVAPMVTKKPLPATPWIVIAGQEKTAKDQANRRLMAFVAWYKHVRQSYAQHLPSKG